MKRAALCVQEDGGQFELLLENVRAYSAFYNQLTRLKHIFYG